MIATIFTVNYATSSLLQNYLGKPLPGCRVPSAMWTDCEAGVAHLYVHGGFTSWSPLDCQTLFFISSYQEAKSGNEIYRVSAI